MTSALSLLAAVELPVLFPLSVAEEFLTLEAIKDEIQAKIDAKKAEEDAKAAQAALEAARLAALQLANTQKSLLQKAIVEKANHDHKIAYMNQLPVDPAITAALLGLRA